MAGTRTKESQLPKVFDPMITLEVPGILEANDWTTPITASVPATVNIRANAASAAFDFIELSMNVLGLLYYYIS
jgi:hypothetical protein